MEGRQINQSLLALKEVDTARGPRAPPLPPTAEILTVPQPLGGNRSFGTRS